MELADVVRKLVGPIEPVGETNTDNARFENLKTLCNIVESLVCDIDRVTYNNINAPEYSRKRAAEYAFKFETDTLGMKEYNG